MDEFRHAVARAVNTLSTPTHAAPVLAQSYEPWQRSRFLRLQELDIRPLAPATCRLTVHLGVHALQSLNLRHIVKPDIRVVRMPP